MRDKDGKWYIGTDEAEERIMRALDREARVTSCEPPSPEQVAMVLHVLADHTSLEQARTYNRMRDGKEDHLWPTSLSIGRWLHDLGYYIGDKYRG